MRSPDPDVTARLHALGPAAPSRSAEPPAPAPSRAAAEDGAAAGDGAPAWAPPTSLTGYVRASVRARLPGPLRGGRWDPGRRGLVLIAVLGVAAVLIAVGTAVRSRAHAVPPVAPAPVAATGTGPTAVAGGPDPLTAGVTVLVDVEGKVHRPGLVTLPAGARIAQAIAAAGGALPGTDTSGLDLAQKVTDGQQLRVGAAPGPPGAGASGSDTAGSTSAPSGALVDINTATSDQLDALPHIGPATAAKIIDWRTRHGAFTTVSELQQVPGIGPSVYEDISSLVTV